MELLGTTRGCWRVRRGRNRVAYRQSKQMHGDRVIVTAGPRFVPSTLPGKFTGTGKAPWHYRSSKPTRDGGWPYVSSVKELRENAEECMGWARSARSDKERSIFLQMARAWSEVAV